MELLAILAHQKNLPVAVHRLEYFSVLKAHYVLQRYILHVRVLEYKSISIVYIISLQVLLYQCHLLCLRCAQLHISLGDIAIILQLLNANWEEL